MSIELPSTLVSLRRRIMDGDLSIADVLARQSATFKNDAWHSKTSVFDLDAALPSPQLPLAGIGLAHKDMFVLPGYQPTCGARTVPPFNSTPSPLEGRLTDAGSTTLGMLTMAEFAAGITGQNDHLPLPVNPIGKQYAVGGSSSGSAIAVAAGLCYGSLGTDTAGSVRVPSATCGIFGLKPTAGVLESQGCFPLAPSLDTVGILARCALDAAVLFAIAMAPAQRKRLMPQFNEVIHELGGVAQTRHLPNQAWRIATALNHPTPSLNAGDELRDAIMQLAHAVCADPVHHEEPLETLPDLAKKASTVLHVEAAATHYERMQAKDPELSAITRSVTIPGLVIPALWYRMALAERKAWRDQFLARYFGSADIVLTPILPHGVPHWKAVHTESEDFHGQALLAMFGWAAFVNYLGLPAIVLPIGTDRRGAPICVQAIGRPYCDARLLAFAHHVERQGPDTPGFPKPCPLPDSTLLS